MSKSFSVNVAKNRARKLKSKSKSRQSAEPTEFDFEESLKAQANLSNAIEQFKIELAGTEGVLRIPLMRRLGNFEAALNRGRHIYNAELAQRLQQ